MFGSQTGKKILFVQLGANGDCLLVTPLVKQIKQKYPNCRLTWAIGSSFKKIIEGNPYVDSVWEVEIKTFEDIQPARDRFETEIIPKLKKDEYDEIIITDCVPKNYRKWFLTVRSSLFRSFAQKVKIPISPIIYLSESEKLNVKKFAEKNQLNKFKNVILIESGPKSGQSKMSPEIAKTMALNILSKFENTSAILSSNFRMDNVHERLFDASSLSFRENAELTKYCSLLIGCSSGISWLMTSTGAKLLPTIQFINPNYPMASMTMDYFLMGMPCDHIIETQDDKIEKACEIISDIFFKGFSEAKKIHDKPVLLPLNAVPSAVKRLIIFKQFKELARFCNMMLKFYPMKSLIPAIAKIVFNRLSPQGK